MGAYYAGIDIGGTNIKFALTDEKLCLIHTDSIPTVSDNSDPKIQSVFHRAAARIKEMFSEKGIPMSDLKAIGLGVAGMVDSEHSQLLQFKSLGWPECYPADFLKAELGIPAFLENDATVHLIGETYAGAAQGKKNVILITLGTGVGGAIMIDGNILKGASGIGGEVGHIYIDKGKKFQTFCSATAVAESARNQMPAYPDSLLWESAGHNVQAVTAHMVASCAAQKDPLCLAVMEQVSTHLAYALASFINVFNPELILIGGGFAKAGDLLINPAVLQTLKLIHHPRLACPILPAALGSMAGALGACVLARQRMNEK